MNTADRIRSAIQQRNREIVMEAAVEAGLGVLFSLLVFGGVFVVSWFSWLFFFGGFNFAQARTVALTATGVFAVAAVHSAWRRVDPTVNLRKLTDFEESLMLMGPALPYGIGMQPRHAVAGFASLLIGGPANLLEAWATWRHRLPADGVLVEKAAEVLHQAANDVEMSKVADPLAALVLHRLGFIKHVSMREKRLALTEKGRGALRGAFPVKV